MFSTINGRSGSCKPRLDKRGYRWSNRLSPCKVLGQIVCAHWIHWIPSSCIKVNFFWRAFPEPCQKMLRHRRRSSKLKFAIWSSTVKCRMKPPSVETWKLNESGQSKRSNRSAKIAKDANNAPALSSKLFLCRFSCLGKLALGFPI